MSKQLFVEQLHTESSPLVKVAIGLLAGLVSSLIYRWNRHAASQDALAYAAMIRQQQEAAVEQKQQQMDTHQKETDGETEAPDSRESVSSDARVYPALPASDGSDTIEDINNIQAEEEVDDEKKAAPQPRTKKKLSQPT
ncbi:expressed unknown protein [Seminavis robusta]|uniref:Uncharacterized protein n=1 Tax=Seminavis robusta TaxID=568900 RepID=A0A9N8DEA5_9STRA|nr:expressed unknown protein [Seminavis robusta]|eukprot:Sro102_g052070.1 n/a (139) ;mRNA; f:59766-60182